SRNKGGREDIMKLGPTLAYQIAKNVSQLREPMKKVLQDDETLFIRTFRHQFRTLIAEPLRHTGDLNRPIVVIDGLDECASTGGVEQLIIIIRETINMGIPLRFLLTSRPERYIEHAFRSYPADGNCLQITL